jgi:hypothetical protein
MFTGKSDKTGIHAVQRYFCATFLSSGAILLLLIGIPVNQYINAFPYSFQNEQHR